MAADILNHQPAAPSTILRGTWLIDLPPNSAIHVRRYRLSSSDGSQAISASSSDDPLERAWRGLNRGPGGTVRDVLKGPCAVLCSQNDVEGIKDAQGRRVLWCFDVKDINDTEDSSDESLSSGDGLEREDYHSKDSKLEPRR